MEANRKTGPEQFFNPYMHSSGSYTKMVGQ